MENTTSHPVVPHCHHEDPDALLGEAEAALLLSVSPRSLTYWRQRKTGPPFLRVGNRAVRYRRGDLTEWVTQQRARVDAIIADMSKQ